ncbi:AarF/UbiB family protein [Nocardioides sp. YIM 152588]|uniref:ABC1 kinase family protein n=1 Tax=Nocardioides sp. YIM 152588 TaxID=3158259 RepID=UPI0032E4DD23
MLRVIAEVAFFLVFVWVVRRMLGTRHAAFLRAAVAALLGLAAGETIRALLVRRGEPSDLAATTGFVLALVFAMLAILALEALSDPARRSAGPRWRSVLDLRHRVGQVRRSAEIGAIASRHGLGRGFGLSRSTADDADLAAYGADLRAAFEEAGGVFVKLGQLLATRDDLLPPAITGELALLHQDARPVDRETLEPALEAALGRPVEEVFDAFWWEPLGAASIGQVHAARLPDGTDVVVKVRRPAVSATIERDLRIATDVARAVHARSERAARLDVAGVTAQFAAQLRGELDYAVEADNLRQAAAELEPGSPVVVPAVIDDLSSSSVLVMTTVVGVPLGRATAEQRAGHAHLADTLFRFQITAMLAGKRFHADPHPGNIILMPAGRLGLIDFGSAGRLDTFERASMGDMLTALSLRDPTLLRNALVEVSGDAGDLDPATLDRAFARMMADHLAPGAEPSAAMVADLLGIAAELQLALPPSMSQMLRALTTLQASLTTLDPEFAILDAAQAFAADEARRELSPDTLTDQLKREVITLAPLLRRTPHHLDRIASQVEGGRLSVRVRLFTDEADVRVVSRLVNRVVLVAAAATLGIVSVLLFGRTGGPSLSENVQLYDLLGFLGLLAGAVLLMRVVLEVLRES